MTLFNLSFCNENIYSHSYCCYSDVDLTDNDGHCLLKLSLLFTFYPSLSPYPPPGFFFFYRRRHYYQRLI